MSLRRAGVGFGETRPTGELAFDALAVSKAPRQMELHVKADSLTPASP
jgi:hypothetical protein